jgi:hypothetical protein
VHFDVAAVDLVDARQALEQRALAGAVAADDAEELARRDLEAHVFEGVQLVERPAAERMQRPLLERHVLLVREPEALVHLPDRHGRRRRGRGDRGLA